MLSALLFRVLVLMSVVYFVTAQSSGVASTTVPGNDPNNPVIATSSTQGADHTSNVCPSTIQTNALNEIENFIILKFGAASFNYIFGTYPGADNILTMQANGQYPAQVDATGAVYPNLPTDAADGFISSTLPNAPVELATSGLFVNGAPVGLNTTLGNPSHSFFQQQLKVNGGKMDRFVAYGDSHGALSMGYYDLRNYSNTGYWAAAQQYRMFDHYFSSTYGDSVIGHFYMVGSRSLPFDPSMPGQCPTNVVQQYNTSAFMQTTQGTDGFWYPTDYSQQPPLTRDCYFVGELNAQSLCTGSGLYLPVIPSSASNPAHFGDVCEAHNVTWAYYSEAFLASELTGCKLPGQRQFNVHEEPFAHFGAFDVANANTTAYWNLHQKDTNDFWGNLNANTLEQVSWWNVAQTHDYGLSNGDINHGNAFLDAWMANLTATQKWKQGKVLVAITSVSPSGTFDFIPPYAGDRFGPGLRLPFVVVSPYHTTTSGTANVNKDPYETYSIFKMIARRFGIADSEMSSLLTPARFKAARDLTASFPGSSACGSSSSSGGGGGGNNGNSAGRQALVSRSGMLVVAVVAAVVALMAWL